MFRERNVDTQRWVSLAEVIKACKQGRLDRHENKKYKESNIGVCRRAGVDTGIYNRGVFKERNIGM
jgi:hypothetical protein